MSIIEKMKNAETTNWLEEGLSKGEINRIRRLAAIAAKIEMKRNNLGLNQKDFAKMMGVTQGMVSRWESGDYNFTITTLTDICDKLELEFTPIIKERAYSCQDDYKVICLLSKNKKKEVKVKDLKQERVIA